MKIKVIVEAYSGGERTIEIDDEDLEGRTEQQKEIFLQQQADEEAQNGMIGVSYEIVE